MNLSRSERNAPASNLAGVARDATLPILLAAGRTLAGRLGLLALFLWLPLLAGCAGYRLGPSNGMAVGDKSVQIRPFANQTLEPRLTDALTQELRRELQRDGTFHLASSDDADIVVSGVITRYNRRELSLSPDRHPDRSGLPPEPHGPGDRPRTQYRQSLASRKAGDRLYLDARRLGYHQC